MSLFSSESKSKIYQIIFEADTKHGKQFDLVLLVFIALSVLVIIIESISNLPLRIREILLFSEWFFTLVFSLEYFLRIYSVKKPKAYIFSFYGIIDFLSVMPTYLSLIYSSAHFLLIIRLLRLLRIFRILELSQFTKASGIIMKSLRDSRYKITVFLVFITILVVIMGSIMYVIEGPEHGFDNIPISIYWAIVTLTTVGYGDLAPSTYLGQMVASLIMITGYAIIAVPTGIITSNFIKTNQEKSNEALSLRVCSFCLENEHSQNAKFCKSCGHPLSEKSSETES